MAGRMLPNQRQENTWVVALKNIRIDSRHLRSGSMELGLSTGIRSRSTEDAPQRQFTAF